ncbi:unnamed protein product [Brachionus calyciflorus]|uniref:Integrase p58-like C-terminal domain-containing protein n=1 Tax=Brachionus calyciflorus TaxID=104777 RepID=A0A813UV38_9BILA|nr:unnamed protein product [Brachionus calyciflorus]
MYYSPFKITDIIISSIKENDEQEKPLTKEVQVEISGPLKRICIIIIFIHTHTTHATTNHTPFEVVYGRKRKIPLDLVMENETEQMKKFMMEDMVMLNQPQMKKGLSKKLSPKWDGPYIIQDKLGPENYKIKKYNQPNSNSKSVHHNRLKRFFGSHFSQIDDSVFFYQSKNNKNLVKRRKHKKIVRAKINKNLYKTSETQQRNEVQNKQQEFLVNSSESVQESADEDDETFKPNHYFQAKLNGSNNQPDDSQNQPRLSKRKTKPVDRLKYIVNLLKNIL